MPMNNVNRLHPEKRRTRRIVVIAEDQLHSADQPLAIRQSKANHTGSFIQIFQDEADLCTRRFDTPSKLHMQPGRALVDREKVSG